MLQYSYHKIEYCSDELFFSMHSDIHILMKKICNIAGPRKVSRDIAGDHCTPFKHCLDTDICLGFSRT